MSRFVKLVFLSGLCLTACAQETPQSAQIDASTGQFLSQSCTGCHRAENESIPDIENLSRTDMLASLQAYKNDKDGKTVMHRLMRGYSETEILELAETLGSPE